MSHDRAQQILCDLIAINTVNPMGKAWPGPAPVERPVVEYLELLFSCYDVALERQTYSDRHENLLVSIPGQREGAATLFESHIDTVPADDWPETAFQPRVEGTKIFGRGACDDKGPLVAMLLPLLELLESGQRPPQPVLFLAAGDEEYAQTGIRHYIDNERRPLGRGLFGEPTQCLPVIQHKGTVRWDITVQGRSAHSSTPANGRNAILDMLPVIHCLRELEQEFQTRYTSELMTGPTLTITMIHGGRTRNAVPDQCTISIDLRLLAGMDLQRSSEEVRRRVDSLGVEVSHSLPQAATPSLATSPEDPFTQFVLDTCRQELGRDVVPTGAPYCTDAAYFPAGSPAIVVGPGDIRHAHAINEFVDLREVMQCARIHKRLMLHDWESGR